MAFEKQALLWWTLLIGLHLCNMIDYLVKAEIPSKDRLVALPEGCVYQNNGDSSNRKD